MQIKPALISTIFLTLIFYITSAHALSWSEGNPEEMEAGETTTISIDGDCPPFTWKVDGEGFYIESQSTEGESNTLNADGYICGSAIITVVDNCGGIVEGSARGGVGRWVQQDDQNYHCRPEITDCSHYIGSLRGPRIWCDVIKGRIKETYLNYRAICDPSWNECPYLGGCEPGPVDPSWGVPGTLFTYYKLISEWICPQIKIELPKGFDSNGCN